MKYALITGGSRGIGRAISLKLAKMGYHLLINYVSHPDCARQVQQLAAAEGVEAELLPFNVANPQEIEDAIGGWQQQNPDKRIEILVNNAGIRRDGLLLSMSADDWNSVVDTSLNGFFHTTRLVLRDMVRQRYGRVINVVSLSGLQGVPGQTNYSASKAAIIGATRSLAQEVARRNVTVNAIAPGYIRTDMIQDIDEKEMAGRVPMNRFGRPEEVADLAGFLASSQASYITGQVISINGGLF
mgnify:CR=1 FL=1